MPVPGGPWIRLRGRCSTVFTAYTYIVPKQPEFQKLVDKGQNEVKGVWEALYLRVVEVWQALRSEAFGQLAFDDDIFHLMTQQLVIDVARHRGLIHSKRLQGALHST